ncbi:MAG: methyltransferase [Myxococcales bacterium]|nr:methyltransferase [Myxococcales bacterium]
MGTDEGIQPTTILKHAEAVYPAFAMLAGMQLDLFSPLAERPMDEEALAAALRVAPGRLSPLLYALVAAGLLTVRQGVFTNSPEADRYLVRSSPDYMGGVHGLYNGFWRAALSTAESIRSNRPAAKRAWSSSHDELMGYFRRQYPSGLRGGRAMARRIDLSGARRLLDAGGGAGGVSAAIAEAWPQVHCTIADLPEVTEVCQHFIRESPVSDRLAVLPVDLTQAVPPGAYDVAVLRALLQVLAPNDARSVLRHVHDALSPGGRIHIVGTFVRDDRLSPASAIGFGLVFLNVYDEGQTYTEGDVRAWLREAGFGDVSVEFDAIGDSSSSCLISATRRTPADAEPLP